MKKTVLTLITILSMSCLVACGAKPAQDTDTGSSKEADKQMVADTTANEATVDSTEVPKVTPAPADDPTTEAIPEPTEEPSVEYEGIDMNSTLSGQEWLETFVGVIEEPKVVVFSDITGKKVIVEQEGEVSVNPDEDAMALFIPEGYTDGHTSSGIAKTDNQTATENYKIFYLDSEKMRAVGESKAAFLVMKGDERVVLIVNLKIE